MIDFYNHYISPSSPARSKLAIHLIARGVSGGSTPAKAEAPLAKATEVIEKGINMLGLGGSTENGSSTENKTTNGDAPTENATAKAEGKEPYLIENVREFKSILAITPGPRPVRELSEFEDLDSKL
jgi:insulysin